MGWISLSVCGLATRTQDWDIKKSKWVLVGWLSWLECSSTQSEKVEDSTPGPGMYGRQVIDISLFLSLKINENISSDEN